MKKEERFKKFTQDMKKAGYTVESYQGRYFYDGPAVICERDEFQDVLRATTVKVIWDSMGLGFVIYPG